MHDPAFNVRVLQRLCDHDKSKAPEAIEGDTDLASLPIHSDNAPVKRVEVASPSGAQAMTQGW